MEAPTLRLKINDEQRIIVIIAAEKTIFLFNFFPPNRSSAKQENQCLLRTQTVLILFRDIYVGAGVFEC
jgi:hypothetical protein